MAVNNFRSHGDDLHAPCEDLIGELAPQMAGNRFNGTVAVMRNVVRNLFKENTRVKRQRTKWVRADVKSRQAILAQAANQIANIGHMGRDEVMLKRNGAVENIESGHIIPNAVWDPGDNDLNMRGTAENLVPQSRVMNFHNWAELEKVMTGDAGGSRYKIDILYKNNGLYKVSYETLANIGITPNALGGAIPAHDPRDSVTLYSRIPSGVSISKATIPNGWGNNGGPIGGNNVNNIGKVSELKYLERRGTLVNSGKTMKNLLNWHGLRDEISDGYWANLPV